MDNNIGSYDTKSMGNKIKIRQVGQNLTKKLLARKQNNQSKVQNRVGEQCLQTMSSRDIQNIRLACNPTAKQIQYPNKYEKELEHMFLK